PRARRPGVRDARRRRPAAEVLRRRAGGGLRPPTELTEAHAATRRSGKPPSASATLREEGSLWRTARPAWRNGNRRCARATLSGRRDEDPQGLEGRFDLRRACGSDRVRLRGPTRALHDLAQPVAGPAQERRPLPGLGGGVRLVDELLGRG